MNNTRDRGISTLSGSFFNTDKEPHESISPEQAREIFAYTVEKEQDYRPNGNPIAGQYHLIRKDNPADEGIVIGKTGVGRQFDIDVQPSHVLDFFLDSILPAAPSLQMETIAAINGGALSFANFHVGGSYSLPHDKSPQYTNVMFVNPLTTGRLQILTHSVRVACNNTLAHARATGQGFRISHTRQSKFYVNLALDAIKARLEEAEKMKEVFFQLDNIVCTKANINRILDAVYPVKKKVGTLPGIDEDKLTTQAKNARENAVARLESDDTFTDKTAWAFLNAMTYPLEHAKVTAKRSSIAIASDNLFGLRAEKKSQMLAATMREFGLLPAAA